MPEDTRLDAAYLLGGLGAHERLACAIALIIIVVPSSSDPKPAPRAMAALVAPTGTPTLPSGCLTFPDC
jgi:hypothetical protein